MRSMASCSRTGRPRRPARSGGRLEMKLRGSVGGVVSGAGEGVAAFFDDDAQGEFPVVARIGGDEGVFEAHLRVGEQDG